MTTGWAFLSLSVALVFGLVLAGYLLVTMTKDDE